MQLRLELFKYKLSLVADDEACIRPEVQARCVVYAVLYHTGAFLEVLPRQEVTNHSSHYGCHSGRDHKLACQA